MDMLVSSALEADSSLPSFFEMFMTQQVEQSLKPAARHAHRQAWSTFRLEVAAKRPRVQVQVLLDRCLMPAAVESNALNSQLTYPSSTLRRTNYVCAAGHSSFVSVIGDGCNRDCLDRL